MTKPVIICQCDNPQQAEKILRQHQATPADCELQIVMHGADVPTLLARLATPTTAVTGKR